MIVGNQVDYLFSSSGDCSGDKGYVDVTVIK